MRSVILLAGPRGRAEPPAGEMERAAEGRGRGEASAVGFVVGVVGGKRKEEEEETKKKSASVIVVFLVLFLSLSLSLLCSSGPEKCPFRCERTISIGLREPIGEKQIKLT